MATSNTFLTPAHITYESAMILKNSLHMGNRVNRQYEGQFAQTGAKNGQTISLRKPPRFVIRRGSAANFQGIQEQFVNLTVAQSGVDMNFTSFDLTLSMDNFRRRYLDPAIATIANDIDSVGLALYRGIPWMIGTPGVIPNSMLTYGDAGAILSEEGAPRGVDRSLMLASASMNTIMNQNIAVFNPQATISEQYRTGLMSEAEGFQWYEEVNVNAHTVGPLGGTPLVNLGGQTGSSLVTDGWTNAVALRLNQGDVFTIGGVFAVNPQNRQSTGRLRRFVATAPVSSDAGGNATIPIYPPITPPDALGNPTQFQTVNASPANDAPITVIGTANTVSPQNLAFHRDAITLAIVDMEVPLGVPRDNWERVSSPDMNVSIRFVMGYDLAGDVSGGRLDVLYGWTLIYPELCVRIAA